MRARPPSQPSQPSLSPCLSLERAVERAATRRGCAVAIGDDDDVAAHLAAHERAAAPLILAVACCHGRGDVPAAYARRRLTIRRGALGDPRTAAAVERLAGLLALGGYRRAGYAIDLWGRLHALETGSGEEGGDGEWGEGGEVCAGCLLAAARERSTARRVADVRRLAQIPGANVWATLPGAAASVRLIS